MKRIVAICAIVLLLFTPVFATPSKIMTSIDLKTSETILKNNLTFINSAYLLQPLGGNFNKIQSTNSYKISCRNHSITITTGSTAVISDGKKITFTKEQMPFINKNRLMLPARKITELLGGKVDGKKLVFVKTLLKDIIFLHHSCGANWIADGQIRQKLTKAGFDFWDHGYNGDGLTDPKGNRAGKNYNVPDDNTNPDGYANIFSQKPTNPPSNTFSQLLTHDVIIIKSCFPVSNIFSDQELNEKMANYRTVLEGMKKHPDKVFIIVTQPPMNQKATSKERAARARKLANFLKSADFLKNAPNVSTFDWFNLLAVSDPKSPYFNMLKPEYGPEGDDSHPNFVANFDTAPAFVQFVISKAIKY